MGKNKFINYLHNKYLYSDDNWKTVKITIDENPPQGYTKETNLNKVKEVKLKFEYGSKVGSYIIKELKNIAKIRELKTGIPDNKNDGYGDEFEILCLSVLHGISFEDAIDKYLVVGSADGKIDGIYIDKDARKCYVYQFKWKTIDDNVIDKMKENIKFYNNRELDKIHDGSDLINFLNNNIPDIKDYKISFKTVSENSKKKENIFCNEIFLKYLQDKSILSSRQYNLKIHLNSPVDDKVTYAKSPSGDIIFVFVNAKTFIEDLISSFGENNFDAVFANNVRGFVGHNEEMSKTIGENPKKFCAYNNGISITGKCDIADDESSQFITVENAGVINGQQTIYNLYERYKEGVNISKIFLPVFIKIYESNKDRSKIAKFNNTQKSVTYMDLLSLDENIRKIQKALVNPCDKNNNGIFYLNIISSGENNCIKNAKAIFGKVNVIKLSDFVKLYSIIKSPNEMGLWKNSKNDKVKDTYKDGFPECNVETAKKICNAIVKSKDIISQNRTDYAIADLAIQYLLFYNFDVNVVPSIIDKVNLKFGPKVKKKADIYKSKYSCTRVLKCIPAKYKNLLPTIETLCETDVS